MNKLNKTIGKLIQTHRKQKNLTQLELAQKLGYSTSQFISTLERGTAPIPFRVLGELIILIDLPEKEITQMLINDYKEQMLKEISRSKKMVS